MRVVRSQTFLPGFETDAVELPVLLGEPSPKRSFRDLKRRPTAASQGEDVRPKRSFRDLKHVDGDEFEPVVAPVPNVPSGI